jgi:hypothetical protein
MLLMSGRFDFNHCSALNNRLRPWPTNPLTGTR